jgi:endonuclease/exonuclease/phosphatase (EEP) superfamily protein YafD
MERAFSMRDKMDCFVAMLLAMTVNSGIVIASPQGATIHKAMQQFEGEFPWYDGMGFFLKKRTIAKRFVAILAIILTI